MSFDSPSLFPILRPEVKAELMISYADLLGALSAEGSVLPQSHAHNEQVFEYYCHIYFREPRSGIEAKMKELLASYAETPEKE